MFTESRAQDFLAVVLGVFAALSPLWVETNDRAMWSLIVLGVLIALTGLAQMYRAEMASADYAMGLFGVLMFLSPWVMDFSGFSGASWTAWVVGVVTVVVAVAALPAVSGRLRGMAPHH
ncbi:SPW repeat protein [Nocardia cyriacigeorgica]|uniref:SPW repeat domain-containing protein n=1 Tax=Nocardia cyriacigeorgica TaxID=135487 RepID=UPI001894D91F|nr:SPW repeat protein [Nocardia cyriacigeorgica]MBF6394870.1 SPW repeat protein [Nocardia cyriacigeorgica]MBF6400504.1 SPW repeat protein [Nocardia cyriacigeorgica]